ncbi:MAG: UDP-N-acetylmuramoyl-tripeptide--D-alanyl-D-alanine ligase [Anaerolineaceae bacterium]|nr:UDP-N-acetylmuramoyl-tripeptide--D-alanyl-D-alanine ligase [Anaerolineaceae bacterium]
MIQIRQIITALTTEPIRQMILTKLPKSIADTPINGAAIDSRQVIPGAMFVALPGERTDGHNFISNAFNNGAAIALIEKDCPDYPILDITENISSLNFLPIEAFPFCIKVTNTLIALQAIAAYWRSTLNLQVVGITGSVGKSSTKELVASVLGQKYHTLKNRGNLNNEIGLPLTLLNAGPGHEVAVLEMGFFVQGEIKLLCEIAKPSIGVVTNIGTVHAERAGSQEIIAQGKAELIEALPKSGTAILNADDPYVRSMANQTDANVLLYGRHPQSDLRVEDIKGLGLNGIKCTFVYLGEKFSVHLPLIGRHSAFTALRAAAVGLAAGMNWEEITAGLQKSRNQIRMVATRAWNGALILDDSYNAAPESTIAALQLLSDVQEGAATQRHIAVLGEMYELGQYEKQGHEQVGQYAAETCDLLIAVGDRSKIIAEAAAQKGMDPQNIYWLPSVQEAIDLLENTLQETDVVLIKGSHGLRMDRITWALETQA